MQDSKVGSLSYLDMFESRKRLKRCLKKWKREAAMLPVKKALGTDKLTV